MSEYTDKAEKTRDSSPAEIEECINMQNDSVWLAPTNPAWPNSYADMTARATKLLEAIDAGPLTLEPAVERSGALREVSLVPSTHGIVPPGKPCTGVVDDAQRPIGCLVHDDEANCRVYHHIEGDEPTPREIADMVTEAEHKLARPSAPINTLLTGLEEG